MATIFETAQAAGVSPAVVSRVANGDRSLRVNPATRQRVLKTIEELDYSPNFAAKSLRSAESGLVALVVHDTANPLYTEIVSGAQNAAAMLGKSVILSEAKEPGGGRARLEELIGGRGIDGLILQGAGTENDRALARAARQLMPTVLLQSGEAKNASLVRLDDEGAGRLATMHLLELGHRKIGCLGVADGLSFSDDRRKGWISAMRAHGIAPEPHWYVSAGSMYAGGESAMGKLRAAAPELSAVVVCNVAAAVGAMARLYDMGVRIPDDLSLVAVHDTEAASYVRPALTVVRTPLKQLGAAAVNACLSGSFRRKADILISNPKPTLVRRASTAPQDSGWY